MSFEPTEIAIHITGVSKSYRKFHRPIGRLIQILRPSSKGLYTDFYALTAVDFTVRRGESMAIIGRNGSGKSTLLQLIYGTLKPTNGHIKTNGKVAALLELGAGFDPEFTGIENLRMTAALYGIPDAQLAKKEKQILAFADIGDFAYQPIKTYSTGMVVRLAFAVIAHVNADILIIDEALAVGDATFTQKCMRFIRAFKEHGTLLFVSHDMAAVQNLCDRAIWLNQGEVQQLGSAKSVAESYLKFALQQTASEDFVLHTLPAEAKASGWQTGLAQITAVSFINIDDPDRDFYSGGEKVKVTITVRTSQTLKNPIVGFLLRDRLGQDLFGENTTCDITAGRDIAIPAGQTATASFEFTLPYLPNGQYAVACSLADGDLQDNIQHHFIHDALIVTVSSSQARWGLVGIRCQQIQLGLDHE